VRNPYLIIQGVSNCGCVGRFFNLYFILFLIFVSGMVVKLRFLSIIKLPCAWFFSRCARVLWNTSSIVGLFLKLICVLNPAVNWTLLNCHTCVLWSVQTLSIKICYLKKLIDLLIWLDWSVVYFVAEWRHIVLFWISCVGTVAHVVFQHRPQSPQHQWVLHKMVTLLL
jgi:hypothetical protein